MLSVKSDRPVDPVTLAVLRAIVGIMRELGLPYFVAGAMARDIVLTHVFGIDTGRATRDVDFAVAVENWDQFKIVKEKLIASGQFNPAEKAMHRLYYQATGGNTGYPLDILPFRGVEQPPHIIVWPPDMKVIMNVIGYEDALAAAVAVTVEPDLTVPIASLPGLALLKLFAWDDRHAETPKDAQDLIILLRGYHMAGNRTRQTHCARIRITRAVRIATGVLLKSASWSRRARLQESWHAGGAPALRVCAIGGRHMPRCVEYA